MKRNHILIILALLCAICTNAQNSFFKELGANNIRYVNATKDGGYIITTNEYLIKFDKKDKVEWTRRSADTTRIKFLQAIPVEAGGYIVLALGGVAPLSQTELIRLDSTGAIAWDKRLYNANNTPGTFIAEDWAGNFVITGYYTSTGDDPLGYIAKISPDGNVLWKRTEVSSGINKTIIRSVECIQTGRRYLISGSQNNLAYISAIKDDGTVINNTAYGRGSDIFKGSSIKQITDGLILLPDADNKQTDGLVMKLDNNGGIIWQKRVGGADKDFLSVVNVFNDTIMLAGKTISFDYATKKTEIYIVKMLANGTVLWSKTVGTEHDEEAVAITRLKSGSYIIVAKDLDPLNPTSYIVKIDENGNTCNASTRTSNVIDAIIKKKPSHAFQAGSFFTATPLADIKAALALSITSICADSTTAAVITSSVNSNIKSMTANNVAGIKIYPNPVAEKINFEYNSLTNTVAKIQVINTQSQVVLNTTINMQQGRNTKNIPVNNLAKGNYILLITAGSNIQSIKFVKQ